MRLYSPPVAVAAILNCCRVACCSPLAVQNVRHWATLALGDPERIFRDRWAFAWTWAAQGAITLLLTQTRRTSLPLWHCLWRWTSCCCWRRNWRTMIWAGHAAGPCHYSRVYHSSWAARDSRLCHCRAVYCPLVLDR